jgi:molybdopterin/thiamine biosynthesis adenylyltransferase
MGRTAVIVGLGNIGSHTAPLVARMTEVSHVVLVDRDRYDRSNLPSQSITPGECGRCKAHVQGIRLRRIRPGLRVTAIPAPVDRVPLGRLRSDVIIACVDNRATRQYLSQASRHLGVPLVDAGVHADGMLARVSTFLPAADAACLECGWSQRDYDAIEQAYPCQPADTSPAAPTGAPADLGSLAAALQAIECRRLLSGSAAAANGSHEVIVDANSHRALSTHYRRNADCRLVDHDAWRINPLRQGPEDLTLAEAIRAGLPAGEQDEGRLWIEGQPFVTALRCLSCGGETPTLRLRRSLADRDRICKRCKGRLEPVASDIVPSLSPGELPAWAQSRSLRALGLDAHDVFAVESRGTTRYFELHGPDTGARRR